MTTLREFLRRGPTTDSRDIELASTRTGEPTLLYRGRYLHSSFDPVREATRLVDSRVRPVVGSTDALVIFGLGLGYVVSAARQMLRSIPIVGVVPHLAILQRAVDQRGDAWWAKHGPDVYVEAGDDGSLRAALDQVGSRAPTLLVTQSFESLFRDQARTTRESIASVVARAEVNRNTIARFGALWVRNILRNADRIANGGSVDSLVNIADSVPAVVCAAGPSLDDFLQIGRSISERSIIVAVDTAVAPLLQHEIPVDCAVIVDPQYWNTRHFDRIEPPHPLVVVESAVNPRVFRLWRGPVLAAASIFPLGQFFDRAAGRIQRLGAGGSVATTAWDLARVMGCSPILMAGLDLGFPDNRTHCANSYFEERLARIGHRRRTTEEQSFQYLHGGEPLYVPGYGESEVLSDRRMAVYRAWFGQQTSSENAPPTFVYGDRGTRIPNCEAMSFEDTHHPFRDTDRSVLKAARARLVSAGTSAPSPVGPTTKRAVLIALDSTLREIGEVAENGVATAESARKLQTDDPAHLKALDRIDAQIAALADRELAAFLARTAIERAAHSVPTTVAEGIDQAITIYAGLRDGTNALRSFVARELQRAGR